MKQAVISGLVYTSIYLARLNFSMAVGNIIQVESRLYFSNDFHD